KVRADVTGGAVALATEDLKTLLLFGSKRGSVAIDETVERRIAREDAADIAGQRTCDGGLVEVQTRGSFFETHVHFVRVLDRLEHLFFETRDAPIPEEGSSVAAVDERRRIAAPLPSADTDRYRAAIGKRAIRIMTRCA